MLDHQRIDVDQAYLQQVQREHAEFHVLLAVARHLAALAEEDEAVGAVPVLDDIQAFLDFPAQLDKLQITAEEDRLNRLAQFRQGFVILLYQAAIKAQVI